MGESFSVGEIAIVVVVTYFPENLGLEVVITEPLSMQYTRQCQAGYMGYAFRRPDGREFSCLPYQLRKKRPPDHPDTISTWDDCGWWPEQLVRELTRG